MVYLIDNFSNRKRKIVEIAQILRIHTRDLTGDYISFQKYNLTSLDTFIVHGPSTEHPTRDFLDEFYRAGGKKIIIYFDCTRSIELIKLEDFGYNSKYSEKLKEAMIRCAWNNSKDFIYKFIDLVKNHSANDVETWFQKLSNSFLKLI